MTTAVRTRGQTGPPLLVPAIAFAVLTLLAVALSAGTPQPSASAADVLAYQQGHRTVLRVASFCQLGASIPLAIWAATAYRRLRVLGVVAPGPAMGLAGGIVAAGSLTVGGALGWTLADVAPLADQATSKALADVAFALGSAGFVPAFSLLVAGVAVPGLLVGLLPRPLAWGGLAVAAVGMVSSATLLTPALYVTLPIGRFGGLLFLIAASALLPRTRGRANAARS